ncbi:pheromone-binding protein-related protein 6-like [Culex pipiens pallens]|uniref:pheromone-binding protein-related protein 6-like n=1 Tax=Culex pipiens pallens TaxID=42434 RepID=UPI00195341BB|nr:pheromone-binding protein-related protein 6-like [Culex pipiens pallens]
MKLAFAIVVIFAGCCMAEFSKKELKLILDSAKYCMGQLSIPLESDIAERVMYNRNVLNDEITKKYITCVMKKMALIDDEGNVSKQAIIDTFKDNYDEELLKPLMEQCATPQGATLDDRMFAFYTCCFAKKTFDI